MSAEEVVREVARALYADGYLRDDGRMIGTGEVLSAFARMREDANIHKDALALRSGSPPSGREVALAFLRDTVEDAQKPMAERIEAARTLLMHSVEGK